MLEAGDLSGTIFKLCFWEQALRISLSVPQNIQVVSVPQSIQVVAGACIGTPKVQLIYFGGKASFRVFLLTLVPKVTVT